MNRVWESLTLGWRQLGHRSYTHFTPWFSCMRRQQHIWYGTNPYYGLLPAVKPPVTLTVPCQIPLLSLDPYVPQVRLPVASRLGGNAPTPGSTVFCNERASPDSSHHKGSPESSFIIDPQLLPPDTQDRKCPRLHSQAFRKILPQEAADAPKR